MQMGNQAMIHEKAIVEPGAVIGAGTRVWANAHILPGARIGENCNICDLTFIENDVVLGNRVTVKCGVQIWDGVRLEDNVFVGPNATFTNDPFPRSRQTPGKFIPTTTTIKRGATIGANATVLPGIMVGQQAMVGAASVVTQDVPPYAVVIGSPAHIKSFDCPPNHCFSKLSSTFSGQSEIILPAKGAVVKKLPVFSDERGMLTCADIHKELPFPPVRVFSILNVPRHHHRGVHAHKSLHEFLICLAGSCKVFLDDGKNQTEVTLDTPNAGLHIPPYIWAVEYAFSPNAVLLVLASDVYEDHDYIRSYDEFIAKCNEIRG
jgi:acetyltransferase-like isoleucine patch superfamily enzyme/dTDP-4-dehydrorhamnose 3,5-epimerase-like enzyme